MEEYEFRVTRGEQAAKLLRHAAAALRLQRVAQRLHTVKTDASSSTSVVKRRDLGSISRLEHLFEQVGPDLVVGGVLLHEGSLPHLEVHQARPLNPMRQILHLDDDLWARYSRDVAEI